MSAQKYDFKLLIDQLSLEEKASLLVGYQNMKSTPLPKHSIPSLVMSDGPHGVRKENEGQLAIDNSIKTLPATCFPSGTALANTFNQGLIYQVGKQIGLECRYYGINAILGPAVNIKRNPLCGRNFEYYSEDPVLAGYLSASFINGVQDQRVLACIKHYACNNLEKWRYVGDSIVDKRALHDIYLKPFEIAVRESNPQMIMTAYNQINHVFASENKYLIEDCLRKRFGFSGLAVTDWGGMVHRDIALNAGQDLEMPGMIKENVQKIVDGVNSGLIDIKTVDLSIHRLLSAIKESNVNVMKDDSIFTDSSKVALDVALESAVLLKNKDNLLPLSKDKKYVVIGDLFPHMRFQGSGSSLINAKEIIDNKKAFDDEGIQYEYAVGYDEMNPSVNKKLEEEAVELAKKGDIILFFGGLTDLSESEGFDRDNMKLDENQIHLISRLCELKKKIVFIMYGGSPFEIPNYDDINAMLLMNLPGQCGGLAMTKLLFGEVTPSGRLSQTWPVKYEDIPFSDRFNQSDKELYKESIYVGYRYYQTFNKGVRFPFGYGLTYGQYKLSGLTAKVDKQIIDVNVTVTNESDMVLSPVVQIYVGKVNSNIPRPLKELKAFTKVKLNPREEKIVNLMIKLEDLMINNPLNDQRYLEDGEYVIYLSDNPEQDIENVKINIKGEVLSKCDKYDVYFDDKFINMTDDDFYSIASIEKQISQFEKKPYTLETPIFMFNSFFGKIIKKEMIKRGDKIIKAAKKIKDENERKRQIKSGTFVKKMIIVNCLRSLSYSSAGMLPYHKALGLLDLANGKVFKALKELLK